MRKRKLIQYLNIQGWMINEINLDNKNELLVYAAIFSFSQDGKSEYRGGRQYLADSLNMTLSTLDRALDKLVTERYIFKDQFIYGNMSCNSYRANLKLIEEFLIHDEYYMEKYSQNEYSQNDYSIQNDEGCIQNDEHIIKDNKDIVKGKPFTPATPGSIKHPRNFSKETLTDDLHSITVIEPEKQKKKSLHEKCIDAISDAEYGFSEEVKQRLRDFLPTTLQAKEYRVSGINQWRYRLKSLVQLSKDPNEQVKIIEYSISHSITGFVTPKKYNNNIHEGNQQNLQMSDPEWARAVIQKAIDDGEEFY